MKTQLKNTAAIIALGIITLTRVQVQAETNPFIQEQDTDLQIESWMTDDELWGNETSLVTADFAGENEDVLVLEDWMIDEMFWNEASVQTSLATFELAEESELTLESWMTEGSAWNNSVADASIFNVEDENSLEIENWMIDQYVWNNWDDTLKAASFHQLCMLRK